MPFWFGVLDDDEAGLGIWMSTSAYNLDLHMYVRSWRSSMQVFSIRRPTLIPQREQRKDSPATAFPGLMT